MTEESSNLTFKVQYVRLARLLRYMAIGLNLAFEMGTMVVPIPQVQKLLTPMREREIRLKAHLGDLDAQAAQARRELEGVQQEIKQLLEWTPPVGLLNMYAEGSLKSKPNASEHLIDVDRGEGDENEDDDSFYDCLEDEEQEEPAPEQPEDPLSASMANEEQRVFEVLNAAMAVLRLEHSDCVKEGEATGKRKVEIILIFQLPENDYMNRQHC